MSHDLNKDQTPLADRYAKDVLTPLNYKRKWKFYDVFRYGFGQGQTLPFRETKIEETRPQIAWALPFDEMQIWNSRETLVKLKIDLNCDESKRIELFGHSDQGVPIFNIKDVPIWSWIIMPSDWTFDGYLSVIVFKTCGFKKLLQDHKLSKP